jgi:hypothetical protein
MLGGLLHYVLRLTDPMTIPLDVNDVPEGIR